MRHPVFTDRVRLIAWWLAWLFFGLGQSLLFYFALGSYTSLLPLDSLISLIIFSGLTLSLWYPFGFFTTGEKRIIIISTNLVITGALCVIVWIYLTKLILQLVIQNKTGFVAYWDVTLPYRAGMGVFIYGIVVLSYYLFISLTNLAEKRAKEARLESLVKETELKLLRSQINPHFLFNSLNSISYLTITDPEKAREMVIKLSEFMRYALSKKDEQPVTFRSELENLRLYLEIERVRFGDRLFIEEMIEEDCLGIKMPVMLLQPLYENAVKHGVYESTEGVRIRTEARIIDNLLKITISNNFEEMQPAKKGTGTGLLNVKRRLELFFGNKASVNSTTDNGLFTVTLYLPVDYL